MSQVESAPALEDGLAEAEDAPSAPTAHSPDEAAVGAVLDGITSFRHRYWAPLLLGVIMLFDSWDSIAIAFAMPTLSVEWRLNPLTIGFLISGGYCGQTIGALALGAISERCGRISIFILSVAIMSLLAIGCATAGDYRTLLMMRLVQGITIGGAMPIAIAYINELAPTRTRGRYFGIFQTLAISGFGLASLCSRFVVPHFGWRGMLGLGAFPILLLPLVWRTLPESPRWLVRMGRRDDANAALMRLGGAPARFFGAGGRVGRPAAPQDRMTVLFTRPFAARSLTITLLWFLTLFTSFGLTTWLPSIYTKVFHMPVKTALGYSAIGSTCILVSLAIAGTLIDRFGRRTVAIAGLLLAGSPMMLLALAPPERETLLVAMVITGQVGIFFGAFVLWPYTAEIYPTNVRALALGYGSAIGRAASIVTPLLVGYVLNRGAPIGIVFGAFGLCAFGALMAWLSRTRETNGQPLHMV